MNTPDRTEAESGKLPWWRPELVELGRFTELVQNGAGKLSNSTGDPGEARKVPAIG